MQSLELFNDVYGVNLEDFPESLFTRFVSAADSTSMLTVAGNGIELLDYVSYRRGLMSLDEVSLKLAKSSFICVDGNVERDEHYHKPLANTYLVDNTVFDPYKPDSIKELCLGLLERLDEDSEELQYWAICEVIAHSALYADLCTILDYRVGEGYFAINMLALYLTIDACGLSDAFTVLPGFEEDNTLFLERWFKQIGVNKADDTGNYTYIYQTENGSFTFNPKHAKYLLKMAVQGQLHSKTNIK